MPPSLPLHTSTPPWLTASACGAGFASGRIGQPLDLSPWLGALPWPFGEKASSELCFAVWRARGAEQRACRVVCLCAACHGAFV